MNEYNILDRNGDNLSVEAECLDMEVENLLVVLGKTDKFNQLTVDNGSKCVLIVCIIFDFNLAAEKMVKCILCM